MNENISWIGGLFVKGEHLTNFASDCCQTRQLLNWIKEAFPEFCFSNALLSTLKQNLKEKKVFVLETDTCSFCSRYLSKITEFKKLFSQEMESFLWIIGTNK